MMDIRRQFLLDENVIFLNHGSFGATPRPVFEAYQRWQRELERQPVEFLERRSPQLLAEAREVLGGYLGTARDDLVFTTNATVAVNIVARSLRLSPEDEVLATTHEYGACDRIWRFLSDIDGFRYVCQPVPVPFTTWEDFVEEFWKGVTSRTKVIFLSHITSPTAMILPVRDICKRAREMGILTLVDGAHAPGQIPLHLDDLGADLYAGNLHKWLCAPKGAGFLYARPETQSVLEPLVISWGWQSESPGPSQFVDHHEWQGTRDLAAFLAVPEAIQFQREHAWEEVRKTCQEMAGKTQTDICAITSIPALHSKNTIWYCQMAAAPLPLDTNMKALKTRLYEDYRIEVQLIEWNGYKLIRVSIQGYNTRQDTDRLLSALQALL